MKTTKIPPVFIRYLKPRLQPFGRPIFWGTLMILSLVGIIIYQYGRYSDWLEASSEKTTNSDSLLDKNLPNQVDQSQFSPEDLAIGADIDNLDLLFQEINQNQNFSLDLFSNSQENLATQNSEDKSLTRFQAKQQTKSDRSSLVSNSVSSSQNNLINNSFLERRFDNKLPYQLFKEKSTLISPINNSINPQSVSSSDLIPNPVGSLYLSNRQKLFNSDRSLSTENNLAYSLDLPSSIEVNSVPLVNSPLTASDSFQRSATESQTQTNKSSTTPLVNRFQPINNFQFEQKKNNNDWERISSPSSQQDNYLQPIDPGNPSKVNSNLLKFQPNNLINYQIQPLNSDRLQPSNYQLQPQELEQLDRETGSPQSSSSVSKDWLNKTNPIDFNNSVFKSNNL